MDLRDVILTKLKECGVVEFQESEFAMSPNPIAKGIAVRYSAYRKKEPGVGKRVSIKVFLTSISDKILAKETNNKDVVQEKTWHYFQRECCIWMRGAEHPNILKLLGIVDRFANSRLPGLVFEEAALGDLRNYVFSQPGLLNATKIQLMRDVASALIFLHGRQITHRDLKSSNILVHARDGQTVPVALLSDFGSAKDFGNLIPVENSTNRTSIEFMAPEHWTDRNRIHDFDGGAGDMWAFGCTMVEILACTRRVWPANYDDEMVKAALESKQRPSRPTTFPAWEEAWKFIHQQCWNLDPSERVTSREAFAELGELIETAP